MKFFVTGVNGQLGFDVINELKLRGYNDICSPTRKELDITNREKVLEMLLTYKPDVIIHCAAYTAVDKAEEEQELCYDINVNGTKYLVDGAKEVDARFVYISTDYVFDGNKDGIYNESDRTCPINYYGKTKLLGEEYVEKYNNSIIVRISWVFGINGNNFVKTMLKLANTKNEISVVSDQVGSPTYTKDLARLLVDMSFSNKCGVYNATNMDYCSWYDFAKYIFEITGSSIKVNKVLTKDYKTIAARPLNSRLSKEKLVKDGFEALPNWKNAVERYIEELKKEGNK